MEIQRYRQEDWPAVRDFLRTHWRPNHPFTQSELFHWQLAGFGSAGESAARLIRRDDEILGFLGVIPGLYHRAGEIVPGAAFDVWIVRPDMRNLALGLLLMKSAEDECDVCCSLGINREIAHYYTRRGYQYCETLHRWIALLDEPAALGKAAPIEPNRDLEPALLSELYQRSAAQVMRLGLHRTADFWDWRYRRSAGFRYLAFGNDAAGAIVAHTEEVIEARAPGTRVLRLIELLPTRPAAWNGEVDEGFAALVSGVLCWARRQGCTLADFQHSSDRLSPLLESAGFVEQTPTAPAAIRDVPQLFQPLRRDVPAINLAYRAWAGPGRASPIDPRDTYFVKSDAGMDRPNVLPAAACEDCR